MLEAKVVRNEVSRARFETFPLKNVCQEMGYKNLIFVDVVNTSTIDCMGKKVKAINYCKKKFKDNPFFIRAFVDRKKEEVVCQLGHRVLLSLTCEGKDLYYCSKSSKHGCLKLQTYFAINHELVHHSILRETDVHQLHCYFSTKIEETADL